MRTRPLRRYALSFRDAATGVAFATEATGETPCEAKNEGWCQLEDAKKTDPQTYPPGNDWNLVSFVSLGVVEG